MDLARIDVETGRGQVLRSYYDENEYEQSNDRKNDEPLPEELV